MSLDFVSRIAEFSNALTRAAWTGSAHGPVDAEQAAGLVLDWMQSVRASKKRLYIVGNGGSAAIAAHAVTDFLNMAKISAMTLHDPAILTCMANDYGYENAYARMLGQFAAEGDMLVAISSSGRSPNICNAVSAFREAGGSKVMTLSGFNAANPLRKLGDVNLWLDSSNYGIVEIGHQFVLHNLSDRIAAALP
jgi:D-sedoheptulose 7-phosphate isomerase